MPFAVMNTDGLTDDQIGQFVSEVAHQLQSVYHLCAGVTLMWDGATDGEPRYPVHGMPFNGGNLFWHKFGDETEAEDPHTFTTIRQALNWLKKTRAYHKRRNLPGKVELIAWVHPDAVIMKPLEEYIRMSDSKRLPGSTRR